MLVLPDYLGVHNLKIVNHFEYNQFVSDVPFVVIAVFPEFPLLAGGLDPLTRFLLNLYSTLGSSRS